jgi:uncharacterized membrane protein YfcA
MKHRKFGHVDLRLGFIMVAGTVAGVEAGKQLVMYMEGVGNVDVVVRYVYILVLAWLGLFMFWEARKAMSRIPGVADGAVGRSGQSSPVQRIRALNLPPFVSLPVSGISRISIWVPLTIGFATGILAGLLGVGGGFIRMPILVYLLGVPTVVAIGTDLFEIIISAAYGAFTYGMAGRVEIVAAALVLVGSFAGVQIGATATRYVAGTGIRQYFAINILLVGVAAALKQVAAVADLTYLNDVATYLLLGVASGMAMLITVMYLRARKAGAEQAHALSLRQDSGSSSQE